MPDLLKIAGELYDKADFAYEDTKEPKLTKEQTKAFLNGDDVPERQSENPWSIQVEQTEEGKDYKKEHPINKVPILNKQLHENGCSLDSEYTSTLANLNDIITAVVAGDEKAREMPEFRTLNFPAIKAAIEWLIKSNQMTNTAKVDLMNNAWMLNFKTKPPTPQEFLSEHYIGDQANSLHPWVKDTFVDYFDPLKPYRTLILTQHIGAGKSTFSALAQLYVSVHYALMWHPYRFFGLAPSSIFTQCLGGWNQKKASELLLEPFVQILECSSYFRRVRTHQDLTEASAEEVAECLHWTTSTPTAQPLDSKIIMVDGTTKNMGDIQIGDKIKSPSEGETEVINIPYHGVADCYEIELEDGRMVRCSPQHLWKVSWKNDDKGNQIWVVKDLQFILDHPEYEFSIADVEDCVKQE